MQRLTAAYRAYRCWARRPATSVVASALACLCLPYLYGILCEFVRTASVYYLLQYLEAHLVQIAFGAVVTALLFAFFTLLTARPWVGNAVVGGVLWLMSWVNLQKVMWRGDPIQPKDLYQIKAAAGIAQELDLAFTRENLLFLLFLLFTTAVLLPFRLPFGQGRRARLARVGLAGAALVSLPLYMGGVLYNRSLMDRYHIGQSITSLSTAYYRGSFVTSFCNFTQSLFPIKAPSGYNEENVRAALTQLYPAMRDYAGRKCDVIVVLLESYFFLDNYDTAEISEPLTENFDRLKAEGISGQMLSSEYGGGTANIEFDVLTGYTTRFLPTGSMPYLEYIKDGFLCYPQFLKAQGYQTMALHPYIATFYNRNIAYGQMGIDSYTAEEAFTDVPHTGNYIGESDTFAKALELYRQAAPDTASAPVFLHIVTMQNHIPNQPDEYPADYAVQASIPGESDYYNGCLTSIATTLRDVDAAIGELCDALREQDRDVVVLFFGDHQTNINGDVGDDLLSHIASFNALPEAEQTLRSHVTPYLMWANFDTGHAGEDAGLLPSYLLLPVMLDAFDVIRPAWFDWLLATEPYLGGLDYELYFAAPTELDAAMNEEQKAVYRAQELLQYDLMFGKQYAAQALYGMTS